jgi:hypothetical protein
VQTALQMILVNGSLEGVCHVSGELQSRRLQVFRGAVV